MRNCKFNNGKKKNSQYFTILHHFRASKFIYFYSVVGYYKLYKKKFNTFYCTEL